MNHEGAGSDAPGRLQVGGLSWQQELRLWEAGNVDRNGRYSGPVLPGYKYSVGEYIPVDERYSAMLRQRGLQVSREGPVRRERTELALVRMGSVDPNGCYFAVEGGFGTYCDSVTSGRGRRYSFTGSVADTRLPDIAQQMIELVRGYPGLSEEDRRRLASMHTQIGDGGGFSYLDFDELPFSGAARQLGFDAVLVRENDDLPGEATSVFVINTACIGPGVVKDLPEAQEREGISPAD